MGVSIMEIKNPLQRLNISFWQAFAEYVLAISVCAALFGYRLATLVPGFSLAEKQAIGASASLQTIAHDPLFLPHRFLQYLGLKLDHTGFFAMRLPSILAGLIAAALFFYILNKWFNLRIAAITTFLMVTSGWFLHTARLGTPEIAYLSILAPLAYAIWVTRYRKPILALSIGALVIINTLYAPGLIWFTLMGVIWQRKTITKLFKDARIPALFILSGVVILLVPLALAMVRTPELIKTYVGLPTNPIHALKNLPANLLEIPYNLFWRGPIDPIRNLGDLPLLDFFTVVIAILGAYSFGTFFKLQRSRLLLGCLILGCLLVGLQGSVNMTILLPFAYILVAGGLNFMIEQWFMVFPYNPLARNLATVLIAIAVGSATFYHLNSYFVAWPQAPATRASFNHQPR